MEPTPDELMEWEYSIHQFIEEKLDLRDFCFFFSHHLNNIKPGKGDKSKYEHFKDEPVSHRCQNFVKKILKHGEIHYIVYYLDKYCQKYRKQFWPQAFYEKISSREDYRKDTKFLDGVDPIEIRLCDFLEGIDLKIFCSRMSIYLNNIGMYLKAISFNNNTPKEVRYACQEIVDEVQKDGYLHYLPYCIAKFWFTQQRAESSVLLAYFFHEDLCDLYTKCKEKNSQKMVQELEQLIKKFTIREKRYIKAKPTQPAIMNEEFYISLGILPKDEQPESDTTACYLTMNANVKDRSIVWQGIVKVKIKSYVPKRDLMIHKKKIYFQVHEPHDEVQWVDFKMKAYSTGKMSLKFKPKQGWRRICDDIKVTVIVDADHSKILKLIIIKLIESNYLSRSEAAAFLNESRQRQAELLEKIEQQNEEKEQLRLVLSYMEQKQSEYQKIIQILTLKMSKRPYHKEYRIKDGLFFSVFQSLVKVGLFGFPPLIMSYQLITLTYKPELEKLVEKVLQWLPKSWPKRLYYSTSDNESRIVGIDLGTSYSSIAIPGKLRGNHERIKDNNITLLKDESDQWFIPSVVAKDEKGIEYVGQQAKDRVNDRPVPITSAKRYLGEETRLPYGNSYLLPEEVLAKILCHLKRAAGKQYRNSNKVVISVPAHFKKPQWQKTREAGAAAGFEMIEFIEDPIAAAMSYYPENNSKRTIMTYDLGGGTFETALVKKQEGKDFEVKGSKWAPDINGTKLDKKLVDWMVNQVKDKGYPQTIAEDSPEYYALMLLAEEAKIALSVSNIFKIKKKNAGISGPVMLLASKIKRITRETYNKIIKEEIESTIQLCRDLLREKELDTKDIDEIILMGGGSNIDLAFRMLKEEFPSCRWRRESPCHCVAVGAAIKARQLESGNREIKL